MHKRALLLAFTGTLFLTIPGLAHAQAGSAGGMGGSGSYTQAPPNWDNETAPYNNKDVSKTYIVYTDDDKDDCHHRDQRETRSGDKPGRFSSNGGSAGNSGGHRERECPVDR